MRTPLRAHPGLRIMAAALALGLTPTCAAEAPEETVPAASAEEVAVEGPAPAAAQHKQSIFVIGDSITTGYGALGAGPDCAATEATHSPDAAYAAVLASRMNANLVVDAVSGRGMVYNAGGHSAETAKARLIDGQQIRSGAYSQLSPALVLVHLGTNDFFQNDPGTAFDEAYQTLLEEIAAAYPKARVLSLFGPMLSGDDRTRAIAAIGRAIDAATLSTGREIGFVELNYAESGPAVGCEWHPGTGTHSGMADTILEALGEGTAP